MKHITLDNFIQERVKENRALFRKDEMIYIKNHQQCIKKIYLLGFMNAKQCYEQKHE